MSKVNSGSMASNLGYIKYKSIIVKQAKAFDVIAPKQARKHLAALQDMTYVRPVLAMPAPKQEVKPVNAVKQAYLNLLSL